MTVKINTLEVERVKRVLAFRLEPTADGLTIIGGKNRNGKTSVLDAIAWGLGGKKFQPTNPKREGTMNEPRIEMTLSNGLKITRAGKNHSLKVLDPTGKKGGQQLLDDFIGEFALNLPKFLEASNKDKARILLDILGVGDQLKQFDQEEEKLYNERHTIGQIKTSKEKHAEELPEHPDAPEEPISASDLIKRQQAILAKNGENQRLREKAEECERTVKNQRQRVEDLEAQLAKARQDLALAEENLTTAQMSAEDLEDQSTAELEQQLEEIEAINDKVAANQAKARAQDEAEEYASQYNALTEKLEKVRADRLALLEGANLPLAELTVQDGELIYRGQAWDCMATSEQLRVAAAIVRQLNPNCGFVLIDQLEKMDLETLQEFAAWAETEGLQIIATRVSTGEECSIIIEDGLPAGKTAAEVLIPLNGENNHTEEGSSDDDADYNWD
jgi:chromosome segregation ATPase